MVSRKIHFVLIIGILVSLIGCNNNSSETKTFRVSLLSDGTNKLEIQEKEFCNVPLNKEQIISVIDSDNQKITEPIEWKINNKIIPSTANPITHTLTITNQSDILVVDINGITKSVRITQGGCYEIASLSSPTPAPPPTETPTLTPIPTSTPLPTLTPDPCTNEFAADPKITATLRLQRAEECNNLGKYDEAAQILTQGEKEFFSVPKDDSELEKKHDDFGRLKELLDKIEPVSPGVKAHIRMLRGRLSETMETTTHTLKVYDISMQALDPFRQALIYYHLGKTYERVDPDNSCLNYNLGYDIVKHRQTITHTALSVLILLNTSWVVQNCKIADETSTDRVMTDTLLFDWAKTDWTTAQKENNNAYIAWQYETTLAEIVIQMAQSDNISESFELLQYLLPKNDDKLAKSCTNPDSEDCRVELARVGKDSREKAMGKAKTDNLDYYLQTMCDVGRDYVTGFNYQEAEPLLTQGIDWASTLEFKRTKAICLADLGELYTYQGVDYEYPLDGTAADKQKYEEFYALALTQYKEAHQIFSQINDQPWLGQAAINMAQLYPYSTTVETTTTKLRFCEAVNIAVDFEDARLAQNVVNLGITIPEHPNYVNDKPFYEGVIQKIQQALPDNLAEVKVDECK